MPILRVPDELTHDCGNCQGLCCMAHKHRRSDGFPILQDKPAGIPCGNLEVDPNAERGLYKCKIYETLAEQGWRVCPEFTCYGAGQAITEFFRKLGVSWAEKPDDVAANQWRIRILNFRYGYQTLKEVFSLLFIVKSQIGEQAYQAARQAVAEVATEFTKALESTERDLDPNYWVRNRFDPAIRQAVLPFWRG